MPTFQPEKPVALAVPPLRPTVVYAPPFDVKATVPVAPPLTLAVQVVFCEPYVIGFGLHETEILGVALLIVRVVDELTELLSSSPE